MIREYSNLSGEDLLDIQSIYREAYPNPPKYQRVEYVVNSGITLIHGEKPYSNGVLISQIDEGEPWIWSLAVRPDFQEHGIATELITEIEKYYPSYKRMLLFVEANNPAQKFYFNRGYRVIRVVKDIYEDQDALKMAKKLK
jgi:ribosomal protein S18 acetylase RimI-like enzyme